MIKSARLINFQSHKNSFIEFDEGVTSLIGLTDAGKTAIFRAINWVVNNRPLGESFQSHWGGDTSVLLTLENGTTIERTRTTTENYYKLNGQKFKAFGQNVPQEISEALNMNEINVMTQMDIPFLLASSSGEVAQTLNKIVNLDMIDSALSNVNKSKRGIESSLKHKTTQLQEVIKQLDSYDFLAQMEIEINKLEQLQQWLTTTRRKIQQLTQQITRTSTLLEDIKMENKNSTAKRRVNRCLNMYDQCCTLNKQCNDLSTVISDIDCFERRLEQCNKIFDAHGNVEACINSVHVFDKLEKEVQRLDTLLNAIKHREVEELEAGERQCKLEIEFAQLMPLQCPLCGQEVHHEQHNCKSNRQSDTSNRCSNASIRKKEKKKTT